ncbi:MAG: WD40 repeat domain-containing protein [Bacteroidales bacterium]|jgi:WD40 repeat protein|nr:WD40 repeat domain-containing protein [Bacteroidales bacterium]
MRIIFTGLVTLFFTGVFAGLPDGPVLHFGDPDAAVYDLCFSPKGKILFVAGGNQIHAYCVDNQQLVAEFRDGHSRQVMSLDLSRDSSLLVSGGKDSLVVLWDLKQRDIISRKSYHSGMVTAVKVSPGRRYLASGATDHRVIVYDLQKDRVIHTFADHNEDITSVDFNPGGNILATSGGDGIIHLYNLESGERIASLSEHTDWVREVAFCPDNQRLISCGDDSKVILWDVHSPEPVYSKVIRQGRNWLLSAQFSPDFEAYAVGSFSGVLKVYTPHTELRYNLRGAIFQVMFVPDETRLKIALATRENGVLIIPAGEMKYKER